MRYLTALLVPLVLLAVYNARADSEGSQTGESGAPGRYEMKRTEDGYIRLDTQTGAMSICHRANSGWLCEAVPDDRLALEEEITRLDEENRQLRELAESQNVGDETTGNRFVFELPTEKELMESADRASELMNDMMERFQALIQEMRKEWDERT